MNITIKYSMDGIVPNDGYEYDEEKLAYDVQSRLKEAMRNAFPDAMIDYSFPHTGFVEISFSEGGTLIEDFGLYLQVKQILADTWQDTNWEIFSIR